MWAFLRDPAQRTAVLAAGLGLLSVGPNLVVARTFAPNAAPVLNLLAALFGSGAVLGPLLVVAVLWWRTRRA